MYRMILIIVLNAVSASLYSQHFLKQEGNVFINELKSAQSDSMRIDLLLKVAEYHILSSYDHPSNYDTATLLISQAEHLNSKVNSRTAYIQILIVKSYFLRATGKRENGKIIILQAISLLKNGSDNTSLGQAYYELSNYYDYDFKYNTVNQRAAYIDTAVLAFEKSGSINDLGNCYKVLADLHHLINEYAKAFSEIEKALEYYKISHYKRLEGVYDLLGQLYYARGDYRQALSYELMALKKADSNYDAGPQLCEIENNVALTFYKLNDATAALRHFKNALEIAEKEGDNETIYGLASHVVETYIKLNKPQEALRFLKSVEIEYKIPQTDKLETAGYMYKAYLNLYTALKEYTAGRYYCNQLINKCRVPGLDVFKLNGYYEEIIKYLTATKDYTVALKYLNKNKELLESMNDNLGSSRNYILWFSLDTSQGNLKSAINSLLKANSINDTVLNATKGTEIKQLEVQYESEKKENDIKLKDQRIKVLTQSGLLRQANLDQAKFTRNATLIASILLLTLGGILFNQYKQKRKTNIVITQRNEQLNRLLKEKEWLIKEVHHRVKNNLQMVISLLNTQSAYLDNDEAIMAIQDSQRRMQTMSLIHQKLYQSENVSVIDMPAYINELVNYLKDIFNTGSGIRFEQDIDPVKLDVSQAIPVGLILNEIITNAIKYAFSGDKNGIITVSMRSSDNRKLLLIISDNGKGLPEGFNSLKSNSLGMSLVTGLVKQLEGRLKMLNNKGVKIIIQFPYEGSRVSLTENTTSLNSDHFYE